MGAPFAFATATKVYIHLDQSIKPHTARRSTRRVPQIAMALIGALICYILYVVVLLYYQYYIGKCKCFTRAQLG